ncbi:hypothetical protein CISG_02749 [Coccidioides immitis RMSCC 3703]|uniref:Uncharacterized protein n=2 Tax=Coccidioides immitis TaxID=5501 RepID=A0A0J8U4D9_COCIT|nr:hypothetical protein CIRG_00323 [Coccidioides immitis RMSCC 2394]KMU81732.1 hypothetical protein CISG_02749 [Coccidioides immitis RMSCC 3703]
MLNSLRTWLAELASPSSDAGSEQGSLNQDGRRTGDDLQFDIIHPGSDSLVRHAKQDGEQVTLSGDPEGAEAPDNELLRSLVELHVLRPPETRVIGISCSRDEFDV